MGLMDTIKDRVLSVGQMIRPTGEEGVYYDEYEQFEDAEDGPYYSSQNAQRIAGEPGYSEGSDAGMYQSPYETRGANESVSVYTRSGRLVEGRRSSPSEGSYSTVESFEAELAPLQDAYTPTEASSARVRPRTREENVARMPQGAGAAQSVRRAQGAQGMQGMPSAQTGQGTQSPYSTTQMPPLSSGSVAQPRPSSGKLPAYTIKPTSYEDAQLVARRVQTNQPVILVLRNTPLDTARRLLDFCFGFTYGISGKVQEVAPRIFAVLPPGIELSQQDIEKLKKE